MKTAIKVLNILTVIGCVLCGIILLWSSCAVGDILATEGYGSLGAGLGFFYVAISAIPAIICLIANGKLNKATCKSDLTAIAIITLLFGNLISGILMLCITDEQL